jgi:hypothetical protein
MPEIKHVTVHGAGDVNAVVSVHKGSAENTAVTVQPPPVAGIPASEYGDDVGGKGGLMTCVTPLQLFVIVSVPVVGGSAYVIVPVNVKVFVATLQGPGTAVKAVMLHNIAQLVVAVLDPLEPKVMSAGDPLKFVSINM